MSESALTESVSLRAAASAAGTLETTSSSAVEGHLLQAVPGNMMPTDKPAQSDAAQGDAAQSQQHHLLLQQQQH